MFSKIIIKEKNLSDNLNYIKSLNKSAKICAVVKANAYGHGIKEIVSLLKNKVYSFGVANIEEALAVRSQDKDTMVIIFGECEDVESALLNDISLSIISIKSLKNIIKIAKKLKILPKLHLNINSGMNRYGIQTKADFYKVLDLLQKNNFKLEGIFTHLSSLTTDSNYTNKQVEIFKNFVSLLPCDFNPIVHIGGGKSMHEISGFDMYRVGLYLYGYGDENLKPVMEVKSKIIHTLNVKKGAKIGYMSAFSAAKDMKIGVIPIGYFDGLKRSLSNKLEIYAKNKKLKNVGNICMDCFMVDLTDTNIELNDEVTVMKNASEIAKIANTSEYEILTNFNSFRGKRIIK